MRNDGYTFIDRIKPRDAGRTVLDFYSGRYRHHDREGWCAIIDAGLVMLDGAVTTGSETVQPGSVLEYSRPPWDEPAVPEDWSVLRDLGDVVALYKPAGLPVTPGAGCMTNSLLHLARKVLGEELRPLHRLDRGTSGVVLFARTAAAAGRLGRDFQAGRVGKDYLARVSGIIDSDGMTVDCPIGEVRYAPTVWMHGACAGQSESCMEENGHRRIQGPRRALTDVEVLDRDHAGCTTLVLARPRTGRPNQIRIHLSWIGHPLVGEPLYAAGGLPIASQGRSPLPGDVGFLLHAWRIRFDGSVEDGRVEVESNPPEWASNQWLKRSIPGAHHAIDTGSGRAGGVDQ
jgi:23S rRNA pseudouridine1911/1915/1917 synthase